LRTCEETHPECPKNNFTPELPSYVVGVSPDLPGITARLHKPAAGEKAKCLCLIYCWGTKGQLTTTKSTLGVHMEALPVHQLGLIIQDAITTTRRLGFRYLWVDALCITQNNEVHKASEIKSMASIYQNATAVISAAAASASSEGFLAVERHFSANHPLDSRAWALQEHKLANRKFVFSSAELLVECRAAPRYSSRRSLRPSLLSYSSYNWSGNRRWMDLVQMYSSRALTDPEDRLNAFEGIAGEIEIRSGKKVRYGVPQFGCEVFSWFTAVPAQARSARAPSWSW
ncbi:heterokaryon incompatibility protein-domain-containing protein, partial [Immersiella caudata]